MDGHDIADFVEMGASVDQIFEHLMQQPDKDACVRAALHALADRLNDRERMQMLYQVTRIVGRTIDAEVASLQAEA